MITTCSICLRTIDTKKERYAAIIDYEAENELKRIWVHEFCFKERFRHFTALELIGRKLAPMLGG